MIRTSRRVVALVSIAAACAVVAAHAWRDRAAHAGAWSTGGAVDGVASSGGARVVDRLDDAVRHSVWHADSSGLEALRSPADESRPTVSIDGRHVVFAVGRRGENADLWIAELDGTVAGTPRRLSEIDTGADEVAPAFGRDALYFASDRPGGAGGLDLWRAPFDGRSFGAPERWGADTNGVATAADETDPCPSPDDATLWFASDRSGSYDLWTATRDASGVFSVARVDDLCTDRDEREPALDPDGRFVYWSTNRDGDHQIARSAVSSAGVGDVEIVADVASPADERGPWIASRGAELWFTRTNAEGHADVERVRALELAPIPRSPWTWLEISAVLGLVLLALLAYLADRWPLLETIYKCYLVSLIVHLLLLWWFGFLHLRGGGDASPRDGTRESVPVRVRVADDGRGLASSRTERAGRVEPSALATPRASTRARRADLEAPAVRLESPPTPARAETVDALAAASAAVPTRAPLASRASQADETLNDVEPRPRSGPAGSDTGPTDVLASADLATVATSDRDVDAGVTRASRPDGSWTPVDAGDPRREAVAGLRPVEVGATLSAPAPSRPSVAPPSRDRAALESVRDAEARVRTGVPGESAVSEAAAARAVESKLLEGLAASATDASSPTARRAERSGTPSPASDRPAEPSSARTVAAAPFGPDPRTVAPTKGTFVPASGAVDAPLEDREARAPERAARAEAVVPDVLEGLARADRADVAARDAVANTSPNPAPRRAVFDAPERAPVAPSPVIAAADRPLPAPDGERAPWKDTPYQNRVGTAREHALRDHGGDEKTEDAVERGLAYLARIQSSGGWWGDHDALDDKYGRVCVGKTALVTLAFLGAGHTHTSGTRHSAVVARALAFLLASQDERTGHFGDSDAYGHGIATYALAEAYALTRDAQIESALRPAVAHILAEQSRSKDRRLFGGWGYFYPDGHTFDRWSRTSITAWMVMALESARWSGVEVPDAAFADAARFLEACRDEERDWFRYNHDPDRLRSSYPTLPASTPAALFALSITGTDVNQERFEGTRRFLLDRLPRSFAFTGETAFVRTGQGNPYYLYYGTLAMFRIGGGAWDAWNTALKQSLLPAQRADGSWPPIDVYARYARDDEHDASYTTALAVLSLEVYYRYFLPLLQVRDAAETRR